ncbi:DUF2845 domain-containing protein [Zooshikella marina]|uniref:DUF2845 domain-containing protein n=1 Tax=Zooshikella ganghwensis TaxID=202772 RepID=A0A4P9VLU3_9GAMM|nr:DUF2845 domain-containing protein [Zooshikella ganghwensis]MBU2705417.1 DUF2845 domain-containing protein [Zooshikella ganghwensis]RDH42852.1 DUF2845 domain-containing protein [Zooshikella ganghwensis]
MISKSISKSLSLLALAACIGFSANTYSDSMRCGSKLVKSGDSTTKVLLTCGEPLQKEYLGTRVTEERAHTRYTNPDYNETTGRTYISRKEIIVEKWTYGQKGQFLKFLIFRDGVLDTVETGGRY